MLLSAVKQERLGWQPQAWANTYRGLKYKEKGRSLSGVDCWGLVWLAFHQELQVEVGMFDELQYEGSQANKAEIEQKIHQERVLGGWKTVAEQQPILAKPGYSALTRLTKLQAFDITLIKMGSFDTHVGLICSQNHMLHILQGTEVTIEEISKPTWERRIIGVYRHPELC